MYVMREIVGDGQFVGIVISNEAEDVMRITGGNALTITTTVAGLARQDNGEQRVQDYLHGILTGITHCVMTGAPNIDLKGLGDGG
jgi:hypothetical protein